MLHGEVTVEAFRDAASSFDHVLRELTAEAGKRVSWVITNLEYGSMGVTATGQADDPWIVDRVVQNYGSMAEEVASAGQASNPRLRSAVDEFQKLFNEGITAIRFSTDDVDVQLTNDRISAQVQPSFEAWDAVEGYIHTISDRGGTKFTLFDSLFDKGVDCRWAPGEEETLRELYRRRVSVEGLVRRDAESGRPLQIRNISRVVPLEQPKPGAYEAARGMTQWKQGDPLPEERIRKFRDG